MRSLQRSSSGGRPSQARLRSMLSWAVTAALLTAWAVTLRPIELGGPAVTVSVAGTSMQPLLFTGDLAIAHAQTDYHVGDLVVFAVRDGEREGRIIHRLIAETAPGVWTTQGDNRDAPDLWALDSAHILGRYWFAIPHAGAIAGWTARHPWIAASGAAALSLLSAVPWRRRRLSPELRAAMLTARREPRFAGQSRSDLIGCAVLLVASAGAAVGLAWLYMARASAPVLWTTSAVAFCCSATLSWLWIAHLFDGLGVAEPGRSTRVLSGRLFTVARLPDEPARAVHSATELRRLAEARRLPILHEIDSQSGVHRFALLTVDAGSWSWTAEPRALRLEEPAHSRHAQVRAPGRARTTTEYSTRTPLSR